jgi:hypothetical protein
VAEKWCAKAVMADITTMTAARPSARLIIEVALVYELKELSAS